MPVAGSRRSWRRLALVTFAAGATLVGLLPAVASAEPATSTAAQAAAAQAKLDQLGVQADKAVEAYNQAQNRLALVTAQAKAQQAAVAQAKKQVAEARAGIQALAVAEYESGAMSSTMTALLVGDPANALERADLLAQVNRAQTASLTRMVNANRQLESTKARADQALSVEKAAAAKVAAQKIAVEKAISAQQQLAASLQAKVQQQTAAAAAAARAAQLQRLAVSRDQARTAPPAAPAAPPVAPPAPVALAPQAAPPVASSGGAAAALRYAYAQLGKPYQFGGAGPNSFDCSGLTMRAWGTAGVSLSHSSSAQQYEGRRVSLSALQPGDLVFWGNPAYHVAIYIGGGRVIAAPHTGTVVQIQAIWGSPSGAVRP